MGLTALAAALRFFLLSVLPPGLYHDEAFNGLDALSVLRGRHALFFPANQGREPLFIYVVAATVGAFGRSPAAIRLASGICGTLTIPATYAMARTWFSRRIGLLSAAILATVLWHVHLSRVGFRAVTLPLMTALLLLTAGWAFKSSRRAAWVVTGILYGATFYSYLPARFTPAAILVFVAYLVWARKGHRLLSSALPFALGALVALIPIGVYAASHWDIVMGRPGRVSVFNPLINGGDLWGTLGRHLVRTLGMFFVQGDSNPRHNLPGRPVFDPLMGAAMILGLFVALIRARRREPGSALILIWVGLMLVPTWLAEDAPHFLRAVGVLPPLVILPALGLESAGGWLERRGWRAGYYVLIAIVLFAGLMATCWDYFSRYRTLASVEYAFEDAATQLAVEANNLLRTGWDGEGIVAACCKPASDRRVYVDRRLVDEWASISFLIAGSEGVTVFGADAMPSPADTALIIVWPHSGLEAFTRSLPPDARITAHLGPGTKGDLEEAAYSSYASFLVEPGAKAPSSFIARFDERIALVGYEIEQEEMALEVQLEWAALTPLEQDYTVSIGVLDQGRPVAQDDAEPCDGAYPTRLWREGNIVVDKHVVQLPEKGFADVDLTVGVYEWPTMERLEVTGPNGELLGDRVWLDVPARRDEAR